MMSLDLRNLRREIIKHLRVLKRDGTVVWIGSDRKWSEGVKMSRKRDFPHIIFRSR